MEQLVSSTFCCGQHLSGKGLVSKACPPDQPLITGANSEGARTALLVNAGRKRPEQPTTCGPQLEQMLGLLRALTRYVLM